MKYSPFKGLTKSIHKAHFSGSKEDFSGEFGRKIQLAFLKELYEIGQTVEQNKEELLLNLAAFKLELRNLDLKIEERTSEFKKCKKEKMNFKEIKIELQELQIKKMNLFDVHFYDIFKERLSLHGEIEIINYLERIN